MQVNLTTVIIIAVATMFFGYFFGLFEGRAQGAKKRKSEEDKANLEGGAAPDMPAAPAAVDDPGLLRLREETGQLRMDLDGARVTMDTLSFEQRKRLIELITRLRPWVEGRGAAPAGSPAPAQASTPLAFASQDRPSAPVPRTPPGVPAATPSATAPKKAEPPTAPQTMVGQIDAILQEKIENTPLGQRGVKLEEAPGGTVNVVVGMNRYEGLGEVPDPEVQAAIRAAIAEWERKFTPG